MHAWISELRRAAPPASRRAATSSTPCSRAEIEGRPITEDEIIGVIQLLILGGLDTTAGALGQFMIRFCREPDDPRAAPRPARR